VTRVDASALPPVTAVPDARAGAETVASATPSSPGTSAPDAAIRTVTDAGASSADGQLLPEGGPAAPPDSSALPAWKDHARRRFLFFDEAGFMLHYVDITKPTEGWSVKIKNASRDLQVIGNNRVLVGTGVGWTEVDITTGEIKKQITRYDSLLDAQRMPNGNTLLAGVDIAGSKGVVLLEVDSNTADIKKKIVYPELNYLRCVRWTKQGTFLGIQSNLVWEGDANGKVLWKKSISAWHGWKALRMPDGSTVVSSGGEATIVILDEQRNIKKIIGGKPPAGTMVAPGLTSGQISPKFFADLRVLPSGNFLVMNARVHADDSATSIQVLEYSPDGKLVWWWKQNPTTRFRQLESVMPLDGLDTRYLYDEANGMMEAVTLVQ
jgi:hypothetical protein